MSNLPTYTGGWQRIGTGPEDGSSALTWNGIIPLPNLGPTEVLVKYHSRSMNYPEISIANGTFPWRFPDRVVVPGSDGAGEVIGTGALVSSFTVGDKVILQHYPGFHNGPAPPNNQKIPGTHMDGTLAGHGVWDQSALLPMPAYLTYEEAATLPCSALTAWNCLFGLTPVKAGDYVLTQGSGGVSVFAIQFALKAGAIVIATTSSDEKSAKLRALGAQHVINYRAHPDWGVKAREIAKSRGGCQKVIDIGGAGTIDQSFKCVSRGGEISIVGFVTGGRYKDGPNLLSPLLQVCTVRGVEVGNRLQFEEMMQFMEAWKIRPVLEERRFALKDVKEAYKYFWKGSHVGKMVITNS
ncbi:hypothetical protein ASPWEDRAFT_54847 [Aspergillus wentii DTO 134E9]|uniref:Enoyl reductase (ER) domain-containing protein n=1 Tax=Aspergillus wentii DTO 134E9 TaxID=1073089 RepID=A0A1L9R5L2_ASPWE|nr:uncharacterized protein ASPWEDRAFT_54847 [Aspergillus wentii DTO 134E9]KAI9925308.1 hypothetical protein MW887_006236 [Aspergillus wentii]OJJ30194.1 hypothetical protein ASPWEDRAFT_54847 [Aspergillus wentii DTO 134E9]